jgi:hypothetical protein
MPVNGQRWWHACMRITEACTVFVILYCAGFGGFAALPWLPAAGPWDIPEDSSRRASPTAPRRAGPASVKRHR